MNQDEAFLRDICEHPDDDGPRLIYADWLDEHGQAVRAEFIRVQCVLAGLDEDDPRYAELAVRARALAAHPESQDRSRPEVEEVSWGSYRRGFLATATVRSVQAFRKHAAAMFAATPLEELYIQRLTPSAARTLAAMPALERLRGLTPGPGAGADGLRQVLLSPHLAKLASLELDRQVVAPEVVAALGEAALPALTTLRLRGVGLDPAGAQALADALHFPLLRTLVLSGNPIGDGAAVLAGSRGLANLTHLDLSGNGITDTGAAALAGSPCLSRLVTLDLGRNRIGAAGVAALIGSPHLAGLRRLLLGGNQFGPTQSAVAAGWHPALTPPPPEAQPLALQLLHNQIDDEGAARLAQWPALGRLVTLDLGNNRIGNAGAAALGASPHLAGLDRLTLPGNPINLAGLWSLAASPHLGRLTVLGLYAPFPFTPIGTPPSAPAVVPAWTGLSLYLNGHRLGMEAARELAAWPGLARVRKLFLGTNQIGAAGATALAASPHAAGLAELDLDANAIGDAGAVALAASPHLAGLTGLSLRNNDIGNAGVQAIASSPHFAGLTSLNLGGNPQLGHAGARALLESPHLGRLTLLGLQRPRAFGTVMADALRQRFGTALQL